MPSSFPQTNHVTTYATNRASVPKQHQIKADRNNYSPPEWPFLFDKSWSRGDRHEARACEMLSLTNDLFRGSVSTKSPSNKHTYRKNTRTHTQNTANRIPFENFYPHSQLDTILSLGKSNVSFSTEGVIPRHSIRQWLPLTRWRSLSPLWPMFGVGWVPFIGSPGGRQSGSISTSTSSRLSFFLHHHHPLNGEDQLETNFTEQMKGLNVTGIWHIYPLNNRCSNNTTSLLTELPFPSKSWPTQKDLDNVCEIDMFLLKSWRLLSHEHILRHLQPCRLGEHYISFCWRKEDKAAFKFWQSCSFEGMMKLVSHSSCSPSTQTHTHTHKQMQAPKLYLQRVI